MKQLKIYAIITFILGLLSIIGIVLVILPLRILIMVRSMPI